MSDAIASDSVRRNLRALADAFADVPEAVKVLKIGEEFGEASEAYIGARGLNPRKGVTCDDSAVADELADVAITALVAMHSFTVEPVQRLTNRLAYVADRALKPAPGTGASTANTSSGGSGREGEAAEEQGAP